jgi:hypothetical protein
MVKHQEDKWLLVGAGTVLALLIATIGIPALPPPVKVPAEKATCLLIFDSPPLSSRFDVTINGLSKGRGLVEKVLEDVTWATAQTMLLEFAAFQKITRQGFHPITTATAVMGSQVLLEGHMYFASEDENTILRAKGTKVERLNTGTTWDLVSTEYQIPQALDELRPLLSQGLWHGFANSPEHLEASVALSAKRIVRITILARNDVSLTCSAVALKPKA